MPLLDIQKKGRQLGRIRIGVRVATGKTNKAGREIYRPEKIETFRFTTPSRAAADAVAALLGGAVGPWTPDEGGASQWEVITDTTELPVIVPPGSQVISAWYEMWSGGGCQRRCDGFTEQLTQQPCLCPHAEDPEDATAVERAAKDRAELAKKNPPAACKPTTRLNVMLPDLPDIGVWRLDSHGFYSAVELGGAAELLAKARDAGTVLPATLRLEQRQVKRAGKTFKFAVPVLEIGASLRQLAAGGAGRSLTDSLPAAPRAVAALEAGTAAAPAGGPGPGPRQSTAQQLADLAAEAVTADQVKELGAAGRDEGVLSEQVTVAGQAGPLEGYLRARLGQLAAADRPQPDPHDFVHDGQGGSRCAAPGCGQFENDDIHTGGA